MTENKEALTARVAVPQSKTDPNAVKFEEIPLPPREMWEGLTNHEAPAKAELLQQVAALAIPVLPSIAKLEFIDGHHLKSLPLKYPFRFQGDVISTINVRRLLIGELETLVYGQGGAKLSLMDIYAPMTGLPADVLRGLIDEDGEALTEVAYDFLPRSLRTESA